MSPEPEKKKEDAAPVANYELLSEQVKVDYLPVWNVPKNYLTGFIAESSTVADENDLSKSRADMDIGLLVYSSKELAEMVKKGNKIVLILRVSLSTIERAQYRNPYLEYCRSLPQEVRSLMVLKVENIPEDMPVHRLQDLLREPSGFMRSLIISTDIRQRRYETLANCKIHAFSVSLKDASMSESKSFALLDRFAEMIEGINHAPMVEDIPNRSLLCAAVGSGINYVCGPAVQSPQNSLAIIRPFDLEQAYKGA